MRNPRSTNSDALYPQYVLRLECLAKAQLNYVRFILRVTAEAETCWIAFTPVPSLEAAARTEAVPLLQQGLWPYEAELPVLQPQLQGSIQRGDLPPARRVGSAPPLCPLKGENMLLCIYFATMGNVPWTFLPWYNVPTAYKR